ncbi:MAG TPA: hypothetical protein P5267_00120 [Patescibacteria group bacterium]|nr:hypothetical protein [Patescibacteria group bacterium]
MSKNVKGFYILVLALAILVLGGCLKKADNQLTKNDKDQEQNQNQNNNQTEDTVNPTGEYTINELLTMNKPLKCTWKESVTGDSDVTNLIYIDGKKFYQDVTMGDLGHAYTISDGEYLYIWNDFTDAASKMNLKELEENSQPTQNQAPAQGSASLEQKRDFVCEKWNVDDSIFTPPGDKNFKDVTEEMGQAVQDLQENADQSKKQICDMCAKAPTEELRSTCLENAQCAE